MVQGLEKLPESQKRLWMNFDNPASFLISKKDVIIDYLHLSVHFFPNPYRKNSRCFRSVATITRVPPHLPRP